MGRDRDAHISRGNFKMNLTRRELVQRTAWALAAVALPGGAELAAEDASPDVSPMMLKLSAYMSEARNAALPDKVLRETQHHILDTFAAMISGSELPPGRMALKFARAYGGPNICTVVASEVLLGPIEAAIANGELAHLRTKPTTTTPVEERIPAAPSCRPRWRSVKKRASAGSTSREPWPSATTSGCARFRPSAQGPS